MRATSVPNGPPPGWLVAFATTSALLAVALATPVFATLAILLAWVPPRGKLVGVCARTWSRILLFFSGVRLRTSFTSPLDRQQSYVFLANHGSYFDIPALLPAIPAEVRFAAKRSLFRIPLFGWSLHAGGFIPIDRGDKTKARENFANAAARLRGGVSVLFFPEGHRSHDGGLAAFQRGGILLALKSGLPIVPVGVRGARRVQPRGRLAVWPGPIEVRFGAPIDPAEYGVRRLGDLVDECRRQVAELAGIEI